MSAESAAKEIRLQQQYYTRTAGKYDDLHLANADEPEHDIALAMLRGFATYYGFGSFLDVGCGTGRAIESLKAAFPAAHARGLEPVAALREAACEKGIARDIITDGDALQFKGGGSRI